jgi:hypothetical protein
MADVNISKYTTQVVREGSKPATPGFVISEGQDPVNPPGTNNYVPYSGATANVELGEFGLETGFVNLDTTPTNIPTEQGGIYWDDTRSTAALIMNGTLQHIGQDVFYYVKNSSGSTIAKGTSVRFDGTDGASGHLLIAPFLADGTYASTYFMGVTAEEILNGEFGQVMHFGELDGIDTSGYTASDLLYASTTVAGGFQTTAPIAPNNIVLIAAAVNSKNNGAIIVRPTYGSNINTDEGVKITTPTTGDLLQLQAGGLWENKAVATVMSNYVTLDTGQTITGQKFFANNTLTLNTTGNANSTILTNSIGTSTYQSGRNFFGFNTDNHIYFAKSSNTGANTGILAWANTATRTYTLKDASGTLAFTSDIPANPVGGTGTTNYLSKFTGASTIGNSQIVDDGTNVGINNASPIYILDAYSTGTGTARIRIQGTTNFAITQAQNSSGILYMGIDSSTAGGFALGNYSRVIYSSNAYPLVFAVNDSERMRITSGGNLLVGTTTDAGARLQVSGAGNTALNVSGNGYSIFQSSAHTYTPNAIGLSIGYNRSGANGETTLVWGAPASGFNFEIASVLSGTITPRLTITNSGNVGIGTTGVVARLTVVGASTVIGQTNVSARFSDDFESTLLISHPSGTSNTATITGNNQLAFATGTVGSIAERMRITSGGNVLIGTTTDNGAKLQVSGEGTFSASVRANKFTSIASSSYTNDFVNTNIGTIGQNVGIRFGYDGSTYNKGAVYFISKSANGVGDLIFALNNSETSANVSTSDERMRITSAGNVLIGTSTSGSSKLRLVGLPTSSAGLSSGDVWNDSGTLKIA